MGKTAKSICDVIEQAQIEAQWYIIRLLYQETNAELALRIAGNCSLDKTLIKYAHEEDKPYLMELFEE